MDLVGLVTLILILALVGFLVWLITTKVPMDETFRSLIVVVTVIFAVLYELGLLTGHTTLPRVR